MSPARRVLVIGAGPAGAATAIHAARRGLDVTLVDRARFPRDKPCSEYMSPAAVRLLRQLGLALTTDGGTGAPLTGTAVHGPWGASMRGRFDAAPGGRDAGPGLALARRGLDAALVAAARAAGATVLESHAFEALAPGGGALLRHDGRTTRHPASLVVGADGLRSRVSRALGPRRTGWPSRMAFVAHVRGVTGLGTTAEMHVGPSGYVGLNPLGGGLANVALVVPARRAAAARGRATAFFHEEVARVPGVAGRVPPGGVVRDVLATGPFASRAARVTAPGVALVGDAAEFFDPFTGEGIWAGLQGAALLDATLLAPLAAGRDVGPAEFARYRRLRRRTFTGQWAVERLIAASMHAPRLFDRSVARLGRRPGMADTLLGVTGALTPARAVLNPWFLARAII